MAPPPVPAETWRGIFSALAPPARSPPPDFSSYFSKRLAAESGRRSRRGLRPDRVVVVEMAAPPRSGGMGGQHRPDLEPLEDGSEPSLSDLMLRQLGDGAIELTAGFVGLRSGSRLPFQLGEVDQLEIGGKGPNQPSGVLEGNAAEVGDECLLLDGVVALPQSLGADSNGLLELIEPDTLVLAQRFTQELAQQPDLGA